MLFQLDAAMASRAGPSDPAVTRTAAESVEPPAALSLNAIRDAQRAAGPVGPPVVFDLPVPQAVRCYNQFEAYVHPVLQNTCARCHNERSPSAFQMIQAKSRSDMSNDLLVRANLDAVLRLVDPQDPSRSRLLSAAVMPHKPDDRPILTGPNHPSYRALATWLSGLKSLTAGQPAAAGTAPVAADVGVQPAAHQPSSPPLPAARPGGSFAADRRSTPTTPAARTSTPAPAPVPARPAPPAEMASPHHVRLASGETVPIEPTPAGQILPGSTVGMPQRPPAGPPPLPQMAAPTGGKTHKTIHVPGIGEVEVVDLDAPPAREAGADRPARKDGIDKAALQRFISGGRSGP
jgi:hypothetical protein